MTQNMQRCTIYLSLLTAFATLAIHCSPCNADQAKDLEKLYVRHNTWRQTMLAWRRRIGKQLIEAKAQKPLNVKIAKDFPVQWDWVEQDCGVEFFEWLGGRADTAIEKEMIEAVLDELAGDGGEQMRKFKRLCESHAPSTDRRWLDLYVDACEMRRAIRLRPLLEKCGKIVFTKHFNMGGSHYAYTEAQSDAQHERNFVPGSALCLLEFEGNYGKVRTLIDDPEGVIRDPDVSFDGRRILFAWKKSDRGDDYHLYEMDVETERVRQLTFGLGLADYEGAYLPNGDIVFNSTRCV